MFKKLLSALLSATFIFNISTSTTLSAHAANSNSEHSIISSSFNSYGYITELSENNDTYYYYSEANERIVSASFKIGDISDIYINDKSSGNIYNIKGTTVNSIDNISSQMALYDTIAITYLDLFQEATNSPASRSSNTTMRDAMVDRHGNAYNGRIIARYNEDPELYTTVTESLTYWTGDRTSEYLAVGTTLATAAAILGLPTAKLAELLGSYLVGNVLVRAVNLEVWHGEAMWTKVVYVNNRYQYMSGKDVKYAMAFFKGKNTGLISRGSRTDSDFNNNNLLIQKGINNYLNY